MLELIVRRTLVGFVIAFLAVTTVFFVASGIGDPAVATLGPNATPERRAEWRYQWGLDASVPVQYARYLGLAPYPDEPGRIHDAGFHGVLQGELGLAFRDQQPVVDAMAHRLPRTLLLSGMVLVFEIVFGLLLGTLAALRRGTFLDTGFMGLAFLGVSIPSFVSGPIVLLVFAFRLGWFPIGGYGLHFWDHVYHGLLPAMVMAVIGAATYARVMRSEMIETMQADYIRTARAKGLSPTAVVLRHGVRNAMLPIVTMIGLSLPLLVNGAIITEFIFNWPGMGRLVIEAINGLDIPTIMGVVLIVAVVVQIGNLIADVAVGALDPRIRLGR